MSRPSRRQLFAGGGAIVTGLLAGCLDDLSSSDDQGNDANGSGSGDANRLDSAVTTDAVVDYPAFIDDNVTVPDDEGSIEYSDPNAEFTLTALLEDEDATDNDLRVSRDLSGDVMTAYIAPVSDGDGFTYHVFANEQFVDYADWYVVSAENDDILDDQRAVFEERWDGVYHFSETPTTEADVLVVADGDQEAIEADNVEMTQLGIARREASSPTAPQVAFDFDFRTDESAVEILHTSGDELVGENVIVTFADERIENPFDVESITAGDSAVIDNVPDGAELTVIYEEHGTATVLATAESR